MKSTFVRLLPVCFIAVTAFAIVSGAETVPASKAQQVLDRAAQDQKFTFILFYKEADAATKSVAQIIRDGVAKRKDQATWTSVRVTDTAEQAIVERFDVSRTPMPLTMAVAPNGAITGIFSERMEDSHMAAAFVTPTMMRCMKSMQSGKLVLVCVQPAAKSAIPTAVKEFQADPEFKQRVVVVSMQSRDPAEAQFFDQMQVDPSLLDAPLTVFLAPPGVMVGKFESGATREDLAAALHRAGKCCDDPNCKHNHDPAAAPPAPSKPPAQTAPRTTTRPGGARN